MKDLWDKTVKELVQLRKKMRDELYQLKIKSSINGLKETHKIRDVRKKIARISTVLLTKIKESYGSDRK